MAVEQAHITVKDLTLAYGSYVVQHDLNFTINRGEVFIIMGGSGCGKSTIMHGLTGLKAPATGQVFYDDVSFYESGPEEKERIRHNFGVMFQSGALWSSMTLAENVGLPLEQYTSLNRSQVQKLVALKLALVGLGGFEDFYPSEISGGMQKRAGVARAMALDPDILFFDEPGRFRGRLLEISEKTGIDISFHVDDIYRHARRLVVFDMDSTLIRGEVIDVLANHAGAGLQVARITESAMNGEIDFKESFSRRVALLKGLDEMVLARVAENLILTEGAERVIHTLNKLGYKIGIISGGFDYFGEALQKRLNLDYVFANVLEIENGKVTGNVTGDIIDGWRKAEILKTIATVENISLQQTIAIGDGANDLPMLSIAGLGIAFHAKSIVKKNAQKSISSVGLDGLLYLMGISEREIRQP
jgi:phosphoserine phosphatase SerB